MRPTKGTTVFRNRAIQIKLAKTAEGEGLDIDDVMPKLDLPSKETVNEVALEITKNTAIAVIAVIGAAALARTVSEVVIHHATK